MDILNHLNTISVKKEVKYLEPQVYFNETKVECPRNNLILLEKLFTQCKRHNDVTDAMCVLALRTLRWALSLTARRGQCLITFTGAEIQFRPSLVFFHHTNSRSLLCGFMIYWKAMGGVTHHLSVRNLGFTSPHWVQVKQGCDKSTSVHSTLI